MTKFKQDRFPVNSPEVLQNSGIINFSKSLTVYQRPQSLKYKRGIASSNYMVQKCFKSTKILRANIQIEIDSATPV